MKRSYVFSAVTVLAVCSIAFGEGGTIKGKVDFKGKQFKLKPIQMSADAACAAMHPDAVRPETVVHNENGTLRDVFVYVKSGLPKQDWPVPTTPAQIDQRGCMYNPHVQGIMAGQPVEIVNSDNTSHNIHSLPKNSPEFNLGQPKKDMKSTQTFKNPEFGDTPVRIKCDVHPWMGAWVHVMPHPFFSTTGKEGTFEIKGLPDGEYEIVAWQEKLGMQTAKVTIKGGNAVEQNFTFERKEGDKKGED